MNKKRELIFSLTKKDFKVQSFRAGGKGGQHQNKTDSGVRIIHEASGARGESRSERSQLTNKKLAFKRLAKSSKFKVWMNEMVMLLDTGQSLEEKIEEAMKPENLLVEIVGEDGKWQKIDIDSVTDCEFELELDTPELREAWVELVGFCYKVGLECIPNQELTRRVKNGVGFVADKEIKCDDVKQTLLTCYRKEQEKEET